MGQCQSRRELFLYLCICVFVYLCICAFVGVFLCVSVCGSTPIKAIAVYVPKEESRLSLSARRKKIDTRKPVALCH